MGNKYIRERPLEEIVDVLMLPPPEEEEEVPEKPLGVDESQPDAKESGRASKDGVKDKKGSVTSMIDKKEAPGKKGAAKEKEESKVEE